MKVVVSALSLALLVPMAMGAYQGQQIPNVVEARSFVVVDPQTNKARVSIGANNQVAGIEINDQQGNRHVQLQAYWNGQNDGMFIWNANGQLISHVP